jgi:hypothetical protein
MQELENDMQADHTPGIEQGPCQGLMHLQCWPSHMLVLGSLEALLCPPAATRFSSFKAVLVQ